MTDIEAENIGKAWLAAGGGWRAGMLWRNGSHHGRVMSASDGWVDFGAYMPWDDTWPDPRDPATVGCMLAAVREKWGDPTIYIEVGFVGPDAPPSAWLRSGQGRDAPYAKEANEPASLVAAMVALRGAQ